MLSVALGFVPANFGKRFITAARRAIQLARPSNKGVNYQCDNYFS
jgi:hypothetical protein